MYPKRLPKQLLFTATVLLLSASGTGQSFSNVVSIVDDDVAAEQTAVEGTAHVVDVSAHSNTVTNSFLLSPPSCAVNIEPANGSVATTTAVTFRWSKSVGTSRYTVYLSTTNPPSPADSIADITDTFFVRAGLLPGTTYYWYITPKNADGSATGCEGSVSSFTTGLGASNDHCENPVALTVSNGYCANPVLGTLAFADTTAGLGVPSCQLTGRRTDVWYQLTIPATGNVTIQTSAVDRNVTDLVVQAYTGNCGSLVSVGCNDDGNPAPTLPSALHAKLGLTNRTPGELILVRVTPYSLADEGEFAICAFDTTTAVMPPVAAGTPGICVNAVPVDIGTAYKYTWATLVDAYGHIIAQVYPNGNTLGVTNASLYINNDTVRSTGTVYYLDRNITLQPQTQPTTDVTTRVYFRNTELQALAAVTGGVALNQLNATRTLQTCVSSATAATCGGNFLSQYTSGNYLSDHFAEYKTRKLSTIYLHKGTTVIAGANIWTGMVNQLWETPGNWSCGRIPDADTDVIINSGTVIIQSAAICRRINTGPSANITVTTGFSLRVAN